MKKNVAGLFLVVSCFMFVVGGCAKNEMVKKEEPVVSTTKEATQVKAKPVMTELPSVQPVKEAQNTESINLDALEPVQNSGKLSASLEKIYFDFDSYSLSSEARTSLQKNTEIIKNISGVVQIEGNCDERGSAEYNLALGEKRAKAAMKYLVTMGIPAGRLSVISYGKERPAIQGYDETAFSKNRRDEFVIQEK
jgi:peptidoglycan-associated lipoprotein